MSLTITSAKLTHGIQLEASNSDSGAKVQKTFGELTDEDLKVSSVYVFDKAFFADGKSLVDATNVDLDLYDLGTYDLGNGAGRDSAGLAHANAKIHYMRIVNSSSSAGNLVVNTSVANGWTAWLPSGTHTLAPGAVMMGYWPAGLAVTDASNHILRLTASGGAVTYTIEFLPSS